MLYPTDPDRLSDAPLDVTGCQVPTGEPGCELVGDFFETSAVHRCLAGFGVAAGFTVRVRVDGEESIVVDEFEFCAPTETAHHTIRETATRSFLSMDFLQILEFIPWALAAQAHQRTLTTDDFKHLKH